jgi:peptidylprolyl isomerase
MVLAKKGDTVRIDYTGTLEDGTVFDSTLEAADCGSDDCCEDDCGCGGEPGPIELTIGVGTFFPLIEEALIGMASGEKKTVTIPAAEAFGEYDDDMVFIVPRSELPADLKPAVGDELLLSGDDDEEIEVTVTDADDASVTFDANHPLAGEDLTFDIALVEIL